MMPSSARRLSRVSSVLSVLVVLLAGTLALAPPLAAEPLPRGDRILGIDVAAAEDGDYVGAFQRALDAGMQSVSLSLDWTVLEPSPGVYLDPDDPDNILTIANLFFPAQDVRVSLSIRPINTQIADRPADLVGLPFDHPTVIARFLTLLDHSLPQLRDLHLDAVAIGSEIDIHLGTDADRWGEFITFFTAVREHLRTHPTVVAQWPTLEIGSEATFPGLTRPGSQALNAALQAETDVLLVSYYPLDDTLRVRDPSVVHQDFATLAGLYPDKPMRFYQLGYPSGYFSPAHYDLATLTPTIGSSEALQRQFIEETFAAWDDHAEQIREICFSWQTDLSQKQAEFFANDDPAFSVPGNDQLVEFLRTLGLRTYGGSGTDKSAFLTLRHEAATRGWEVVGQPEACVVSDERLCLLGNRFAVEVAWEVPGGEPPQGAGQRHPLTEDTGAFWFFGPENLELMVKVIDGRSFNGRYWVFYGALTNVAFTLTVTDTQTGQVRVYTNPQGNFASRGDTEAF